MSEQSIVHDRNDTPVSIYCDACHTLITTAGDCWVEWMDTKESGNRGRDYRICHNTPKCRRHHGKDGVKTEHLSYFMGEEGLDYLLYMLEDGKVQDAKGFARLIRRIHCKFDMREAEE